MNMHMHLTVHMIAQSAMREQDDGKGLVDGLARQANVEGTRSRSSQWPFYLIYSGT